MSLPNTLDDYLILIDNRRFIITVLALTENYILVKKGNKRYLTHSVRQEEECTCHCVPCTQKYYIDKATWKMYDIDGVYVGEILAFKPLDKCIDRDVERDMSIRSQLVGKTITVDDEEWKVERMDVHFHVYSEFTISHRGTHRQIRVRERDLCQISSPEDWKSIKLTVKE